MTVDTIHTDSTVLFECVAGSRAYGLNTHTSDTDIRGVFAPPASRFFGLHAVDQVNSNDNNVVYFELRRFVELLAKNNPNVIELLGVDEEFIQVCHPLFKLLTPALFLSKRCLETFGRYAHTQIRKAQGLNKKVLNPVSEKRKHVVDFCYVLHGYGSKLLADWLTANNYEAERCGLVRIPHFRDVYAIFHDATGLHGFRGIVAKSNSDDVATSTIPDYMQPVGTLSFNRDAYSRYCRDYTAYHTWVQKRNEERYRSTIEHGKNYDAKNMMHVFRLLGMAEDIARYGEIRTRRTDRTELLAIRSGVYSYQELTDRAEQIMVDLEESYRSADLPDAPDEQAIEHTLVEMRMKLFGL